MNDYAKAFVTSRGEMIALIDQFSEDEWNRVSPLTPLWRVRDVIGHLCGASEDVSSGNFPSGEMSEWTQAQVDRHRDEPLADVAAAWLAVGLENSFNESFAQMLFDQMTHEFDVRFALRAPGDHHSAGVHLAALFGARRLQGKRAIDVRMGDDNVFLEGDGPTVTVETTHFELLRAMTGRRSWAQIVAMGWSDTEFVQHKVFASGFFTPQPEAIIEANGQLGGS